VQRDAAAHRLGSSEACRGFDPRRDADLAVRAG
jgi:hypothetical protein